MKQVSQVPRQRIQVFFESFAIFFAQTLGAKIHIYIKVGDGCAEHIAVFAVNRSSLSTQLDVFLMEAIAQPFPVPALDMLDIECFPQNTNAQQSDAQKAQIDPP